METITKGVQKLCFWTEGEEFTRLVRTFLEEGNFEKAYKILSEGGLPDEIVKKFCLYEVKFEGDTRKDDGLEVVNCDQPKNFAETFYWMLVNIAGDADLMETLQNPSTDLNMIYLRKIFTLEEITPLIWREVLKNNGFYLMGDKFHASGSVLNGAILRDGSFVTCGYMEHNYLFPLLSSLGLADSPDWADCNDVIHISSNSIGGRITSTIEHKFSNRGEDLIVTQEQLDCLFKYRKYLSSRSISDTTMARLLFNWVTEYEDMGGKFNGLTFLNRFYPEIKTPTFSKISEGLGENVFIRTSPKKSLPGLLTSIIVKNDFPEIIDAIEKIKNDFTNYIGLLNEDYIGGVKKDDNELHIFFQEYIEGDNGVCSYSEHEGFKISVSSNRGEIVSGKKGNTSLTLKQDTSLRKTIKTLSKDLDNPLQLEFVVLGEEIIIVQLRLLTNNPEETVIYGKPDGVVYQGLTFSKGNINGLKREDVLVVDSEAQSRELIGKKALIVKSDQSFSHILALAKAFKIPAIYGVGEIELPDTFRIMALNLEAFIIKQ